MDAFASAEEAVCALLDLAGAQRGAELFKQKIAILKSAKATPNFSKARKQELEPLLGRLEALLPLRADLVHARLNVAVFGEEVRACFANARQIRGASQIMRTFTLEGLRSLTRDVNEIVAALMA